jgi:hypothetical protein
MAMLTIDSVDVPVAQMAESPPRYLGELSPSFNGVLRNSIRDSFRIWSVTTGHMTTSEKDTFIAAVADEQPVSASGDTLTGSITIAVELQGSEMVPGLVPVAWVARFVMKEVG